MKYQMIINNFIGINEVVRYIRNVAKYYGREDVYKRMMDVITKIHGVVPWDVINEYASQLGIVVIKGNKPDSTRKPIITSIIGKGKFFKERFGLKGLDDKGIYAFDGEKLVKISMEGI